MARKDVDVCVIGGGVAGALVAYRLGRSGISTVVLEAGPRHPRPDARFGHMERHLAGEDPWASNLPARDLYTNAGEVDYPLNEFRVKAVGGTTLHWSGSTPRYHESDFELRSRYGVGRDWPLSYDELEPYYCEAERELGVAGSDDNPFASFRSASYPMPAFPVGYDERLLVRAGERVGIRFHPMPQARTSVEYHGRPPCMTFGTCRACPIGAKYSGDIHIELAEKTGKVTVIADANVVRLESDDRGRVRRAVYATRDRVEHECTAKVFVVAAHAIESARLLLLSRSARFPDGLANTSGAVGRYFMEHLGYVRTARLKEPLYPYRKGFVTTYSSQFHDTPKRDEVAGFRLHGYAGGPRIDRLAPEVVPSLVRRSGNWGPELERELVEAIDDAGYGRDFIIGAENAEPLPSERNRIELNESVLDHFGNPTPRLHYYVTEYERTAYTRGDEVIQALGDAMGAESLSPLRHHFGGHQAGTCRMGTSDRDSVVNGNLRAHDVSNLYMVGSATFPTLPPMNPTLTIAALALRLSDHLADRPGGKAPREPGPR